MKYAKLPVVLLSSFASMKRDSTNGAIVDFILKNINEDLTVKMVAEGAHVGNASVSRFIKDLGLSGFLELRELILYSDCQFIFVDSSNVENEVFESCTHALEIAKNSVDVQRIDVLCDAIKQAKEIAIFGLGKAECAAICLQMDLFSLGKNAYSSIQYSEQIEYIKQAEKDCLIILFSATSSYFEYYDIRQWKDKIQRSNVWYIGSGAVPDHSADASGGLGHFARCRRSCAASSDAAAPRTAGRRGEPAGAASGRAAGALDRLARRSVSGWYV